MRSPRRMLCVLVSSLILSGLAGGCDTSGPPLQRATRTPDSTTFVNSLGMRFVRIPAGTFQMGSTAGQADERPVHPVTISEPFYLSEFEVTQRWWRTVMGENPSHFREPWRPVENVSWYDVQAFIERLNAREDTDRYRLPTEAEWEYAARAGSRTTFYFGNRADALSEHAWYNVNADSRSWPVGRKRPNPYGLYDLHGNVWEWIQDVYDPNYYAKSPAVDPRAANVLTRGRVIRGGSWHGIAADLRIANRGGALPDARSPRLGFRLVREMLDE